MSFKANCSFRSCLKVLCLFLTFLPIFRTGYSQTVFISGVSNNILCGTGNFEVYGGDFLISQAGHSLEVLLNGSPTLFGVQTNSQLTVGHGVLPVGPVTLDVRWVNTANGLVVDNAQYLLTSGSSGNVSYQSSQFCVLQGGLSPPPLMALGASYQFQIVSGPGAVDPNTGEILLDPQFVGSSVIQWIAYGCDTVQGTHSYSLAFPGPATFYYSPDSFCQPPFGPNFTGPPTTIPAGGTFINSNLGLIVQSNGDIDVMGSQPGTYSLDYDPPSGSCATANSAQITILAPSGAAISYQPNSACQTSAPTNWTAWPLISGGGYFIYDPNKLTLNPSTGAIDVNNSQAGTHTIGYAIAGPCPDTAYTTFTISASPPATLIYSPDSVCQASGVTGIPTVWPSGGTFSFSSGLYFDLNSGQIYPQFSSTGTHTVTYTPDPDSCALPVTTTFTIYGASPSNVSYQPDSACRTTGAAAWTLPPLYSPANGTFSSATAVVDPVTGAINTTSTGLGQHTIVYTPHPDSCYLPDSTFFTINSSSAASFAYTSDTLCQGPTVPFWTLPPSTAPAGGTFLVSLGLVADANGRIDANNSQQGTHPITYVPPGNTCYSPATVNITINPYRPSSISYPNNSACATSGPAVWTNAAVATPTNGTFSAPANVVIDPNTGAINTSASAAGTHNIVYYPPADSCSDPDSTTFIIFPALSSYLFYADSTACATSGNPQWTNPPVVMPANGTFSGPAGLAINTSTGAINTSASNPGPYTITYTPHPDSCATASTHSFVIYPSGQATFTYPNDVACQTSGQAFWGDSAVVFPGNGTFSGPFGVVIDSNTGAINLSASSAGTHTITYTPHPDSCATSATADFTINSPGQSSLNYTTNRACQTSGPAVWVGAPVFQPTNGVFTAPPGVEIDSTTGEINTSNSIIGTHVITYTPHPDSCAGQATANFTIDGSSSAVLSYPSYAACQTTGPAAFTPPASVQPANGTFSGSANVVVNSITGAINTTASGAGLHTITYTPHPDSCATATSVLFTINQTVAAVITYASNNACQTSGGPNWISPANIQPANGTFSSATLSTAYLDPNTGAINTTGAPVATHAITYTPHSDSCATPVIINFTINAPGQSSLTYTTNSACQTSGPAVWVGAPVFQPANGVFSAPLGVDIDSITGEINTSNSIAGMHTITYTPHPDSCAGQVTALFTLDSASSAVLTYPSYTACQTSGPALFSPPATVQPTNGTFSGSANVVVDPATGAINTTASSSGTHTITYTPHPDSCATAISVTFTLKTTTNATIYYITSSACQTSGGPNWTAPANVQPANGTFSSTTLSTAYLDPNTGAINTTGAPTGPHIILYTPHPDSCANPAPANFNINSSGPATFFYTPDSLCETTGSSFSPAPNTGGLTGTFASSDPNLALNAAGSVDLGATPAGTYSITFHPVGSACADSATTNFTVLAFDDASFSYPGTEFCLGEGNPAPLLSAIATPGGTFSSPSISSVVLADSTTGEIDIAGSLPCSPSCLVQYTTNGTCPNSSLVAISLNDTSAYFDLPDSICKSTGGILDATNMRGQGMFTLPLALDPASPTATNNQPYSPTVPLINVDNSSSGTHTVSYTLTTATCSDMFSRTLEILPALPYNAQYPDTILCLGSPITQLDSARPGPGYFTYMPVPANPNQVLTINPSTGAINPGIGWSDPGRYEVIFVDTDGPCFDSIHVQFVNIVGVGTAALAYDSTRYCAGDSNPLPASFSPPGGTFRGSPGLVVNDTTGLVDLANSTPNVNHTVVYRTAAGSCQDSTSVNFMVLKYHAEFHYGADTLCNLPGLVAPIFDSLTGPASGTYYGLPAGLNIDNLTGDINPNNGNNTFAVFYVMDSICTDTVQALDSITLYPPPNPAFFLEDSICLNDPVNPVGNPAEPGGTFWVVTGGCVVDSLSGEIDLSTSPAGSCQVAYTPPGDCVVSDSNWIELVPATVSTFSYPGDTFCTTGDSIVPITPPNFTPNGQWSNLGDPGLFFKQSGVVDLAQSPPGLYVMQYNSGGDCPTITRDTFEILNGLDPFFEYNDTVFCNTGVATVVSGSINSTTGSFSNSSGLSLDVNTGEIDLAGSVAGVHTITYTATGSILCPQQQTATIEVVAYDTSTFFTYAKDTFCIGDQSISPTIVGDTSGIFSMSVVPSPIDSSSGTVDLTNLVPANYTVNYSLPGICQETYSTGFHLLADEDPSFAYHTNSFCPNIGNPLPQSIATPGGNFSGTNGVVVSPVTGELFLSSANDSLGWIGQVYYATSGRCPAVDSVSLTIYPEVPPLDWDADPGTSICVGTNVLFETRFTTLNQFLINGVPVGGNNDEYESDQFENGDLVQMVHSNDAVCWDTVSVTMEVNAFPVLTITDYTETAVSGEPIYVHLQSNTEGTRFRWKSYSFEGVVTEPDSGSVSANPSDWSAILDPVVYSPYDQYPTSVDIYIQTSAYGCEGDPDTVTIRINPEGVPIFVPELVTPNGDGFNDTWQLQWDHNIDPYDYTISLYNRSYGLVREMNPLFANWDAGTLPDGIYKWILRNKAGDVERSGGLTIRRK